jgi:hypothetical protein
MYFTRSELDKILKDFNSSNDMIEPVEYLKEYMLANQEKM